MRGASIMKCIANSAYLLLYGACQTGESSYLEYVCFIALRRWVSNINFHIIQEHYQKGLTVIQLNFKLVNFKSLNSF